MQILRRGGSIDPKFPSDLAYRAARSLTKRVDDLIFDYVETTIFDFESGCQL